MRSAKRLAKRLAKASPGYGTSDRASAWEGHTHSWAPGLEPDTSRCDDCGLTIADELLEQAEPETKVG